MIHHHFMSYSSVDGRDFALRLADALVGGAPSIPVWVDKRDLRPGEDWDEQIVEAIRNCDSMLFIMTRDSVRPNSVCKQEWTRALGYKKAIVPIRLHANAEMPFRLDPRQFVDFSGPWEPALAQLRMHLQWLDSPKGRLQALQYRLADAYRDRDRAMDQTGIDRIDADIEQLQTQIQEQKPKVENPEAAANRTQKRITNDIQLERQPEKPASGISHTKFINPPPAVAPSYFQDRHTETSLLGDFLKDDALRLAIVVGRGGTGKTAMVCRLLKALEAGHLPEDGGQLAATGIVYLSAIGTRQVQLPHLYADLGKLLAADTAAHLEGLYTDPQISTEAKMRALLVEFPRGRVVVLLDNFEDVVDPRTLTIKDAELDEALQALLTLPQHAVKVIITTRIAPQSLLLEQPGLQMQLDLDEGLSSPYAEEVLRKMDVDGKLGLKAAPDALLAEARERTRGYPRALEALVAILRADRNTSLREILDNTRQILPDNVVKVLVGEAFSRLDAEAQQVIQALAIYGHPVTPTAVDYLLQSYVPAVNSSPVLGRLVNMQFARRESGRYYLHPIDRSYAQSRVPQGAAADRDADPAPFTQLALLHRAANYFEQIRLPRADWKKLDDLEPQLAEFDLRCAGGEYDTAASLLDAIDGAYLFRWSYYRLQIGMHQRLEGHLLDLEWQQRNLHGLGNGYSAVDRHEDAIACYEKALTIARTRSDRWAEGALLAGLAGCYTTLGEVARAIDYFEQSLAIAGEIGDRANESIALEGLGGCYVELGEIARAIDYHQQSLDIARDIGNRSGEGTSLGYLGDCYGYLGQYARAINHHEQALTIRRELGARFGEAGELGELGNCYANLGQTTRAIDYYEQALAILREIGSRADEGVWLANLASSYAELEQISRTLNYLEQALTIAREIGFRRLEGRVLDILAATLCDTGRYDLAVQRATEGLRIADEIGSPEVGSNNGAALALAYLHMPDLPRARAAAQLASTYDVPDNNHRALTLLGVIALRQGDLPAAQAAFESDIAQADALLALAAQNHYALDSKALALCGLTLCGDSDQRTAVAATFRAARAINRDPGVVARVRRLFDALAEADSAGLLADLRAQIG